MAAPMRKSNVVKNIFDKISKVQNGRIVPNFTIKTSKNHTPILGMSGSLLFQRHMCQNVTTPNMIFIDTHSTVKAIERSGLTAEQAECLTGILVSIMKKNTELNQKELVTKHQQEIVLQQVMSHIASVKKDMVILEKSEFSALRSENEKLVIGVNQLRQQLADEIQKLANTVKLDINLERSRSIEMSAGQEQEIESVTQTIRTEVANMTAKLEATKTDMIKYFAGTLLGCVTLGLGFYRILIK
ncbi:mitochondrial calcium uniporter regulator 1 isoform X1 [Strongylocentrotus purpuratus]|uniref:Mitochondrial calcium uniporter regulator 1 n=1 Tax=Strongylocentrotus purpuratus TaxID=7668 RepID=A0A7M7N6S5_STRPU|nr:mitochondrial calcium uniporter regulator 1 isoform X1 [Strongylocentrotus purpuratus]